MKYDVFVSHASEDKQSFVEPLVKALGRAGLKVWYDRSELKLGDSLWMGINDGMANSRYGIVVLSRAYFRKTWAQRELTGLVARQDSRTNNVILPIWHDIGVRQVKKFSSILADMVAAKSKDGLRSVVAQVVAVVKGKSPGRPSTPRAGARVNRLKSRTGATPLMIQYVEARRIIAPWVFSAGDVQEFREQQVDLLELEHRFRQDDSQERAEFWKAQKVVARGSLTFGEWLPRFGTHAACTVRPAYDPGDSFRQYQALQVVFGNTAVSALDEALKGDLRHARDIAVWEHQPEKAPPQETYEWQLKHVSMRCLPDSPVADIISIFDVPRRGFRPMDFDAKTTVAISNFLDALWPVFFAVLDKVWRDMTAFRAGMQAERNPWDSDNWAFGFPAEFQKLNHSDFDPSEERQLDNFLVLTGYGSKEAGAIRSKLKVPSLAHPVELADEGRLWLSDWATAVWERPQKSAFKGGTPHYYQSLADFVLSTVLISAVLKYETFTERLYKAILAELAAERLKIAPTSLRRLVARTDEMRKLLTNRRIRSTDWQREVYDHWAETCKLTKYEGAIDKLSTRMLHASPIRPRARRD
jgi:hypothetical protein